MNECWQLPTATVLGGTHFDFHGDFRDILQIIACLEDPELPEYIRWQVALELFYKQPIPVHLQQDALAYLVRFLNCGKQEEPRPGTKLLDWEQDSAMIVADVNKVAGQEIRALPFVHWWTFLAWFHGIGEGQLSTVVSIRDKLRRGKKLETWEKDFYRENRQLVELKKRYTQAELQEQERLKKLLGE